MLAVGGPGVHGLPAEALRAARADAVAHLVDELGHALQVGHPRCLTVLLLGLLLHHSMRVSSPRYVPMC